MPRLPRLLSVLLAALVLSVAPALAAAHGAGPAAPSSARVATDDGSDDPGDPDPGDDWSDEDPGDDVGDCVVTDQDGTVISDESCWDDGDPCVVDDGSGDDGDAQAATASADASGDEDPGDDWSGENPGAGDTCDDEGAGADDADVAPPTISALHATTKRHGRVQVSFRLDRAGRVTLALVRLDGRASGGSGCVKGAHASKLHAGDHKTGKACSHTVAVSGSISVTARSGANATTLRRWNGHRLQPGSYRLTAAPAATGARDATTSFTLRPPARGR